MATSDAPRVQDASPSAFTEVSSRLPTSLVSTVRLLRFATSIAVLVALALFPRSALFPIRAITVEGADHLSPDDVIARAQLQVGDRLFAVPASDVAARIMAHPWIASADVHLERSGTVRIRLTERSPYAAVGIAKEYYVVDRDGITLERLQLPPDLPILTVDGTGLARPQLGTSIPPRSARVALEVLEMLPPHLVRPGVQMTVGAGGDLTLMTEDRIAILLGQARGLQERTVLLVPLLEAVRRQPGGIEYVDLRYSGNVVVKPAGKSTPRAGVRP